MSDTPSAQSYERGYADLHVLHVYKTYYPDTQGGLEEVIRQICASCKNLGTQNRVLTLTRQRGDRVIHRPEATIVRSPLTLEVSSCGMSFQAVSEYRKQLAWAQVVNFHFPWPFADVLYFSSRMRRPSLVTYHSDIVRQRLASIVYRPLMNRFLSSVDQIVCTSPNYFATSPVLTRYSDKVDIVPLGLDPTTYPQAPEQSISTWRRKFGRYFLFVGVLRYYKGLHILIEAMRSAPYDVVIAGSGPTEQELKRRVGELGLQNVHFTGYVSEPDKVALFKASLAVVFPSCLRSEAFGVTLLEGAMYGKPLISTELGSGTSHVNVNNLTGLVIPPNSAKALREAMDYMWQNPETAELMGHSAKKRYENLFTGELMGQRYANLYATLANADREELPQSIAKRSP